MTTEINCLSIDGAMNETGRKGEQKEQNIILIQKTNANAKGKRMAFPVDRMGTGPGSVFAGEITSA